MTAYPVTGEPPSADGASHVTWAPPLRATTSPIVGAPGTVIPSCGVTAADSAEFGPVPTAFTAATRNVYVVPLVRPVTCRVVMLASNAWGVWATPPMNGVTA